MLKYFRLLRLPNLLMIPLTMYLLRYGIIQPALQYAYADTLSIPDMDLVFSDTLFFIVVIINMLLGGAGYVINDYFDRKIDTINRPKKVLIGNKIDRRTAIIIHFILNGLAIVLATYLSWQLRNFMIVVVYMALAGIFWMYSTTYKKQFLVGNIVVSVLTALVPLQVAFFDVKPLNITYGYLLADKGISFNVLYYWMLTFSGFAFLTNLVREIVKDMEDYEGDINYDCKSLPIVLGITPVKWIVASILSVIIGCVSAFYFMFLSDTLSLFYLLITIVLPLIICVISVFRASTSKQYYFISICIKIVMLFGILYTLLARYIMSM